MLDTAPPAGPSPISLALAVHTVAPRPDDFTAEYLTGSFGPFIRVTGPGLPSPAEFSSRALHGAARDAKLRYARRYVAQWFRA